MTRYSIDFESYSEAPIRQIGAWTYSRHPSTEVLCCAYAKNDEAPQLWTPGDPPPAFVSDIGSTIYAHNAFFEFVIWLHVMADEWGSPPALDFWRDTAAEAAALALPRALGNACKAVGLPEDQQKDKRGKYLIQRLCQPWRGERNRDPELLQELYDYCIQDVIAERALGKRLLPLSPEEQTVWQVDAAINLRGIPVDRQSVRSAITLYQEHYAELEQELRDLTGLSNPNSPKQLKGWLANQGSELTSLAKADVVAYLETLDG